MNSRLGSPAISHPTSSTPSTAAAYCRRPHRPSVTRTISPASFNFGMTLAYTSPSLLPMEVADKEGVFTSDMSAEESDGT